MRNCGENEASRDPKKEFQPPQHSGVTEQIHNDPDENSRFPQQRRGIGNPGPRLSDIISISRRDALWLVITSLIAGTFTGVLLAHK